MFAEKSETPRDLQTELIAELRRLSDKIDEQNALTKNWRLVLRNGVAVGLGTFIGATVLAGLLLWIFKPFLENQYIQPIYDTITQRQFR